MTGQLILVGVVSVVIGLILGFLFSALSDKEGRERAFMVSNVCYDRTNRSIYGETDGDRFIIAHIVTPSTNLGPNDPPPEAIVVDRGVETSGSFCIANLDWPDSDDVRAIIWSYSRDDRQSAVTICNNRCGSSSSSNGGGSSSSSTATPSPSSSSSTGGGTSSSSSTDGGTSSSSG